MVFFAARDRASAAWAAFAGVIAVGILYRIFAWQEFRSVMTEDHKWSLYLKMIYYPTWGRLDGLVLGVGIAALKRSDSSLWRKINSSPNIILSAGVILISAAIVLFQNRLSLTTNLAGYPILSLGFAFILASAISSTSLLQKIRIPGMSYLAILSYSFYLVHKQIIHLTELMLKSGFDVDSKLVIAVIAFPLSVLAAFGMYQLIERPFLVIRDRLSQVPPKIRVAD